MSSKNEKYFHTFSKNELLLMLYLSKIKFELKQQWLKYQMDEVEKAFENYKKNVQKNGN